MSTQLHLGLYFDLRGHRFSLLLGDEGILCLHDGTVCPSGAENSLPGPFDSGFLFTLALPLREGN